MTDKYVNKRWIDQKMKYDPLYLFENKPEKFKKFLRKRMGGQEESQSAETVSEKDPVKISKPTQNPPSLNKAVSEPVKPAQQKIEVGDLINFSQPETFEEF